MNFDRILCIHNCAFIHLDEVIEQMAELSIYEQIRQQNIQRNEQFLQEIGIDSVKPKALPAVKRKRSALPKKERNDSLVTVSRRSSRVASQKNDVDYNENLLSLSYDVKSDDDLFEDVEEDEDVKKMRKQRRESKKTLVKYESKPVSSSTSTNSKEINSNFMIFIGYNKSADHRRIDAGILMPPPQSIPIVLDSKESAGTLPKKGEWTSLTNNNLGRMLDDLGPTKATIMAASNYGSVPSFSKYSGVVEWKNCVYLWVNISGNSSQSNLTDYVNIFRNEGKTMTWFGGSRMHADSPITKRLLRLGKVTKATKTIPSEDASEEDIVPQEPVLLFVRRDNEPYACLGPVKVLESNVDVHPITITWELMLFDQLVGREHFNNILAEGLV